MTDDEINAIWSAKDTPLHRTKLSDFGLSRIRAILAAYTAKLLAGVEMPEPFDRQYDEIDKEEFGIYGEGQLLFYGDARDQAGYLRGLEDAKQVCETEFTVEGIAQRCAAAIDRLKGGE